MCDSYLSVSADRIGYAGMKIVEFDAEFLAPFKIVEECLVGLLSPYLVCVGEVDEVRAVRHDMLVLVVGVGFTLIVERCTMIVRKRRISPFAL